MKIQEIRDKKTGFAILGTVIFFTICFCKCEDNPPSTPSHRQQILRSAERDIATIENEVKTKLAFPLTADFVNYPTCKINPIDTNTVLCVGLVKCTNAFNVPCEYGYEVIVSVDGNTITPIYSKLINL